MSSLGISLLILVILCIGGVVGFNIWQSRRAQELGLNPQSDPHREEPSFGEAGSLLSPTQSTNKVSETGSLAPVDTAAVAGDSMEQAPQIGPEERRSEASADSVAAVVASEADSLVDNAAPTEGSSSVEINSGTKSTSDTEDNSRTDNAPGTDDSLATEIASANEGDSSVSTVDESPLGGEDGAIGDNAANDELTPDDLGEIAPGDLARYEAIVVLKPLNHIDGQRLAELTQGISKVGTKPIDIAGVSANGSLVALDSAAPGQSFDALQISVLLINRKGALTAMEYSEFVSVIQKIADELDVLADVPDMNRILARSRQAAVEVEALDAQVAVNVEVPRVLSASDLTRAASQTNLVEHDGQFQRLASANSNGGSKPNVVFSVAQGDTSNRFVLMLDVPRVPQQGQPIREMVECAWQIAQANEGSMVDDSGRPIDNNLFERIESQLDVHYEALLAAGLPAGSALARRVFQ